jgi:hypothetical protein
VAASTFNTNSDGKEEEGYSDLRLASLSLLFKWNESLAFPSTGTEHEFLLEVEPTKNSVESTFAVRRRREEFVEVGGGENTERAANCV